MGCFTAQGDAVDGDVAGQVPAAVRPVAELDICFIINDAEVIGGEIYAYSSRGAQRSVRGYVEAGASYYEIVAARVAGAALNRDICRSIKGAGGELNPDVSIGCINCSAGGADAAVDV